MYRILPVVVYVCKSWSLTLKEDRRLRVTEDRVLRRMVVPEREEVTGDWRKMHSVLLVIWRSVKVGSDVKLLGVQCSCCYVSYTCSLCW